MPTLVNETQESGGGWSEGETAGTSGMRWVAENLNYRASLDHRNNASTCSESLLESETETRNVPHIGLRSGLESKYCEASDDNVVSARRPLHLGASQQIPSPQSLSRTWSDDNDVLCTQRPSSLEQNINSGGCSERTNQLRETQPPRGEASPKWRCSQSFDDSLSRTLNEEEIMIHLANPKQSHHPQNVATEQSSPNTPSSNRRSPPRRRTVHARPEREIGPNEKLYTETYAPLVAQYIRDFQLRYPGQLRDYRSMNDDEKRREQERVIQLLQRLSANKENTTQSLDMGEDNDDDIVAGLRCKLQQNQVQEKSTCSDDSACETSMLLLSPEPTQNSKSTKAQSQILFSPMAANHDASDTSMALSPVKPNAHTSNEARRGANDDTSRGYESPETVRREMKRLASTSGKRGADLVRARLLDDADVFSMDNPPFTSPSKGLVNSIGRLSLGDESIFSSSQSPIAPRMTHSSIQNDDSPTDFAAPDISFGDDPDESDHSLPPGLDNDSLIETAMLPDKRVRWDFDGRLTKEAPTDVRLLGGKAPHWPKLPTERLQKAAPPTQSFPDPLSLYSEKQQRRLCRLYQWLYQLDCSRSDSAGSAVFLSLTAQTIVDLVLKLQLDSVSAHEARGLDDKGLLSGNTLIVARSKEDLDIWGRSYREGSACSVLNHASLPMSQRKSTSTSDYAVQFDVVLTTYDALKSPDVTLTLDSTGYVTNKNTGLREGWYTSASQAPDSEERATKKQFSALHRVNWNRIVFLDVLGRKSYLAKADTARVQAARAINSSTRLVFFLSNEDEATGVDALLKTDRTVCQSLSSVLRLRDGGADAEAIRSCTIDFQDKSTYLAMKVK